MWVTGWFLNRIVFMDLFEADAKAKELHGPAAYAKENKNGLFDILIAIDKDVPILLGWGHTWDDAFILAEKRAEWHGWLIEKSKCQIVVKQLFLF